MNWLLDHIKWLGHRLSRWLTSLWRLLRVPGRRVVRGLADAQRRVRGRGSAGGGAASHTPKLWPVPTAAAAALVAASTAAYAVFLGVHRNKALVGTNPVPLDVTKVVLTMVAGAGAVLAAVYAYRKQRLAEGESHRADAETFTTRFNSASEQLGHDKAAVRLAGVYAMARLADDWVEQRQTCVNVLCAYLRMPYGPNAAADGERTVRLTVIESIRERLLNPDSTHNWCRLRLDFSDATFDGADFSDAVFMNIASFDGAAFVGHSSFQRSTFARSSVSFDRAKFSSGRLDFRAAKFRGASLSFRDSDFLSGSVDFQYCSASNGSRIHFERAKFSGAIVRFNALIFNDSMLYLENAKFTSGSFVFGPAKISHSVLDFSLAEFDGAYVSVDFTLFGASEIRFRNASFDAGTVDLTKLELLGGVADFSEPLSWQTPPRLSWWPSGPIPRLVLPASWPPALFEAPDDW